MPRRPHHSLNILRYYPFHSGTLSLIPSTPAQTVFTHLFASPFPQPPHSALAIVSFSSPLQPSPNDNSFYVIPRTTSTMLQVASRLQSSNWYISRVTFMASANSELLLEAVSARKCGVMQLSAILIFRTNPPMLYSKSPKITLSIWTGVLLSEHTSTDSARSCRSNWSI